MALLLLELYYLCVCVCVCVCVSVCVWVCVIKIYMYVATTRRELWYHFLYISEMSLFKAREWWGTTVGEEEEYDQGCLCVANIDNNNNPSGKLLKFINKNPA